MAHFLNRWFGFLQSSTNTKVRPAPPRRRLRAETLETRQLLAANLFHNELMPEDVNNDGVVSAVDALTVINEMNRQRNHDGVASTVNERGMRPDVNNDGRHTSLDALMVINRLNREQGRHHVPNDPSQNDDTSQNTDTPSGDENPETDLTDEVRSIDGSNNNLENPDYGTANSPLLRVADADYADGISEPAGTDRPSAREISNTVAAADPEGTTNDRNLSDFVYLWGQFIDHDIDLSLTQDGEDAESFDIAVPTGDLYFDPSGSGEEVISLTRAVIADGTGTSTDNPAEQVNAITAWIDGSQVYGSNQATTDLLREFSGGRMRTSDGDLLPTDEEGNVQAGDIRVAENLGLTSMQTLFLREHNRIADDIADDNPDWSDEEIFQAARTIVIAEIQSITYNEFLPALLGEDAIADYEGYDASVDPSIANEFSTAAFRFGHSTLSDEIDFVGNDGVEIREALSLANAFFNPSLLEETGIDSILKAGASSLSQEVDLEVVDSLRNFLFGAPGSGGFDLVSLNIQRGRDHGLADLNSVRTAYGLQAYESFSEITSDSELSAKLESLYGDVNNIDLWVGLLAEDHAEDSSLGETSSTIIADQFERIRDGDRFYYENTLSNREIREIENTTLADVIQRNTDVNSLQENVFFFEPSVSGTVLAETSAVESISANRDNNRSPRHNDRPRDQFRSTVPIEGVTVELLDDQGNLVDSVVTDSAGNYKFDAFDHSGEYQVRVAATDDVTTTGSDAVDILISSGDVNLKGINLTVFA
ncbi:heme peroxidase, animal [Rhodopirellula maiorica SM1]|uniref:Heme peroxidase, animal n=1 Tax=Rhodopirellula maiorica SM1 TaxID=1265738 RepID=M5RJS9_9BACT|nr:peroxidase family protein [Rhodopirellula maiorica]EMI19441.1 heme peroxidase, animal [Rhodopirellula maiorica SM1]